MNTTLPGRSLSEVALFTIRKHGMPRRSPEYTGLPSGRSAAWSARLLWEQEAGGSNPPVPTGLTALANANFGLCPLVLLVLVQTLLRCEPTSLIRCDYFGVGRSH